MEDYSNTKRLILIAGAALSFVAGICAKYSEPYGGIAEVQLITAIVGSFLTFTWFLKDCQQRSYAKSKLLSIGVLALAILALPYYFFHTRGLREGAKSTLWYLLVVVGSMFLGAAGSIFIYYIHRLSP